MKKILVPTDFSALSLSALHIASTFAKASDATIILFHKEFMSIPYVDYIEPSVSTFDVEAYNQQKSYAQQELEKIVAMPAFEGVKIVPYQPEDFEELGESIGERKDIDLIVMGSKGASGWQEFLDGSHAESVIRHAHCPVLVVKQPIQQFYPQKVMIAVDFETPIDDKALKLLEKEIEEKYIVFVNAPDGFEDTRSLSAKMEAFETEHHLTDHEFIIYNDYSVSSGILHCAEDLQVDLIVMATKARKGLSHFFFGSVTETVINHGDFPVLALAAHE